MEWLNNEFDIESLEDEPREWETREKWLTEYQATLNESNKRFIYNLPIDFNRCEFWSFY